MDTSSSVSDELSSNNNTKDNKKQAYDKIRSKRLEDIIESVKEKNRATYTYFRDSDSESTSDNEAVPSKQKRSCTEKNNRNSGLPSSTNHTASHRKSSNNAVKTSGNLIRAPPSSSSCTTTLQAVINPLCTQQSLSLPPSSTTATQTANTALPLHQRIASSSDRRTLGEDDEQHNDANEATNESHSPEIANNVRQLNQSISTPRNRHTSETHSEQYDDDENEVANQSHHHCKQWIDDLIAETFEYYMKGEGIEDYKKRYTFENDKVYLGLGISMEPIRWSILQSEANPVKFVRVLALKIWGSALVNRAVVVRKVVNKNRIPGHSPVKELEKCKLRLLISIFSDYLKRGRADATFAKNNFIFVKKN